MGFTMNSLQIETVTPDKAREYLGYNYAHNRALRPGWVKYLAEEMREGRFMPTAEIHIMYCNGEPVLVNGQHTCNAIALYGKPVRATVRKSSTTEHGQVAMMYAFGHDNGVKRTFNDGLGAYNIAEQYDLGPSHINTLATALRHIRTGFGFYRDPGARLTEIIDEMHKWMPFAKMFWGMDAQPSKIKQLSGKKGTFSVILTTLKFQNEKALEFWSGVLAPNGLLYHDPRSMARMIIDDSKALSVIGDVVTPYLLSRQLARCWRAFLNGEIMKIKPRISGKDSIPIVIVGTPFTGRQPAPPWWPDEEK